MAVTLTAMEVLALGNFLSGLPTYSSVGAAASALALTGTEGAGFAGVAYSVAGGAAQAVTSTGGLTEIITLAEASNLGATGVEVATSGIGLFEGGVGSYEVGGLLGISSPIIAAAVAPLLGVSLGAMLYEENPSLWKKISMTILPFCYPDTEIVPTWAEVVNDSWILSIPKSLVEAIKQLFEDEGIPLPSDNDIVDYVSSDLIPNVSFPRMNSPVEGTNYEIELDSSPMVVYNDVGNSVCTIATSKVPGEQYNLSYTHDGRTVYFSKHDYFANQVEGVPKGSFDRNQVAWTAEYGNIIPVGGYPEGTSKWSGDTPTEIPESKPAVISTDGTTQPMVPISVPYEVPEISPGQNVPSPNPEEQPDPTVTDNPEKQVDPYIMPYPVPWDIINPNTETDINPYADPSQEPAKPIESPDIPDTVLPDIIPPIGLSPIPNMPNTPMAFASDVGLVTVYHPTPAELYAFERWLWVTLSQASVDTVWNNPFDGVITLFELYCTPTDVGRRTIHSGFLDSGVDSAVISRYTEINCGTLGIPEYYGNYLDYSPYSKAHIYLPFIGVQELNVDDIVGHMVNVTYRIDEYNGSCIAMITVAKVTEVNEEQVSYRNTMYQFSGNCAVELPISGGNQSSILAGMMTANAYQQAANISAGAQLVGGIASTLGGIISLAAGGMGVGGIGSGISNIIGAAGTQAYGQANALSHMLSGKSTVQKSGQFGSSHGALGIKTPFITITRPKQIQVPNYEELYGFPAHKRVMINACTGFLRCREVHVISPTATEAEKGIIESMLKSGVYVTE